VLLEDAIGWAEAPLRSGEYLSIFSGTKGGDCGQVVQALPLRVCPEAESEAWICTLAAVPTVPVWLPGLVTVTVFPVVLPEPLIT